MSIYHINNSLASMGDIQREYGFKVVINPPANLTHGKNFSETGIIFPLVRQVTIPGRTNTPIESNFVGMKQKFPGKEEFNGNFTINVEENSDLSAYKALYEWKQKVFNVEAGISNSVIKSDIIGSASIFFLDFAEKTHPAYVKVKNIWPIEMPEIQLQYDGTGSVKYAISFAYDYWTLENADKSNSVPKAYSHS